MADEIASLKVVIEAEDKASSVIDKVSSQVGSLGDKSKTASDGVSDLGDKSEQASEQVGDLGDKAKKTSEKFGGLGDDAKKNAEKLIKTGAGIKSVGDNLNNVTKPLQYASVGLAAAGVASAKFAIDFEDSFAGVEKTVDGTPEQLKKIKEEIIALSTTGINGRSAIPMTTTELNELAAAGGQLGIQTENIVEFTETMAQLGTATNLVGSDGAATMARFANVMKIPQGEIRNTASAVVDLGNNSATTEAEIMEMALRMGKFGQTVRMDAADVLGYSTALSSLGVEAQAGGSAIGRTWLSIEQAVASGGEELEAFAKYSGKSADEFAAQWNTDSSGAFNGLLKGLQSAENLTLALKEIGINNTLDIQAMMALVNGYDLVTESVERANTAYSENTALQEEFDKKAETTASQLQIAKQNVMETARSIGEIMLPTIADVSTGVANAAQGMADWSDAGKKTIIGVSTGVIALGAASKATASGISAVGNAMESWNKIKLAAVEGSKLAGVISSIGSVAGPAALGIVAVGTATAGMYVAARKYEQYRADWSRGGEELAATIKEDVEAVRELNDLQWELNDLDFKINSGEMEGEELENAKQRLEEIKKILNEKYNLDIDCDTTQLDAAIEKAKQIKYLEVKQKIPDFIDYGDSKKEDFENAQNDERTYQSNIAGIKAQQDATANYRSELLLLKDAYDKGEIQQEEFKNSLNKLAEATGNPKFKNTPLEALLNGDEIEQWSKKLSKKLTDNEGDLAESQRTMAEYKQTMTELADAGLTEIEFGDTEEGLRHITTAVKNAGLNADEYARKVSLIQTKQESLDSVWQQGGQALDDYTNQYISNMQQFGASASEIAKGAALIKNGFADMSKVKTADDLEAISRDATEVAKSLGELPEGYVIKISAEGDVSVIEEAENLLKGFENQDVNISINADGDLSVVDLATGKIQNLQNIGAVSLYVNAEGDIEVLDDAQQKIATIDGETGEITVNGDYPGAEKITKALEDQKEVKDTDVKTTVTGSYPGKEDIATALSHQNSLSDKEVTYTVHYATTGTPPTKQAKGTQNFEGGLAMVNDQRGIADPRELIIDNGRAFIPQGRDVVLPLSKGAKVYTASQTKDIMRRLGIPRYASGKDNSDAFTSARDDWTHITNIRAVSVTEELEKWVEFSGKFTDNLKDAQDIEEQIFSASLKVRDAQNELSEAYILERAEMNDWQSWGDNAINAFNRVRDRENQYVAESKITVEEADKYLVGLGQDMYDARIANSKNWLEHETEYSNLSAEEYMAGIDRMEAYTKEYYANGIIDAKKYYTSMQELNDMALDKQKAVNDAEVQSYLNSANGWYEQRELYDDWEDYGDSPVQFYERFIKQMETFFKEGKIGWEEYNQYVIDNQMNIYKANSDMLDDMISAQQEYIDEVSESYDELINQKETAKREADLESDFIDAARTKVIYEGAVTQRGKEIYKEADKQMDDIVHQQKIMNLQKEQKETVDALRADLAIIEKSRKVILKDMNIDLDGITNLIQNNAPSMQKLIKELTNSINKLNNSQPVVYGDTNLTINEADASFVGPIMRRLESAIAG